MSLDGFIATKNDEIDWLDSIDHGENDYGYQAFTESVDTYIVGKRTYDVVLKLTEGKFPQSEKFNCFVLTRTPKEPENGVTFYSGDIGELIGDIKTAPGMNIYCDGGGKVVSLLLEQDLIDEFIISVFPILLGDGIRLFPGNDINRIPLEALPTKRFDNGMIQVHYRRKRL
jgi:dihydrofolate reductase